jgi:hypothetical protein
MGLESEKEAVESLLRDFVVDIGFRGLVVETSFLGVDEA